MTLVPSHRSTTSSRKPGKAIEGTVFHESVLLIPCPSGCGALIPDVVPFGRHAPHLLGTVLVNCINQPLPESP